MVSDLPNSESVAQYTLIKVLPPVTPNVIIQVNIISYGHSILVTAIDKAVFFCYHHWQGKPENLMATRLLVHPQ